MSKSPTLAMLPWWPRDYLAATRGMTLAERGAYTDLLFYSWDTGPLPNDPKRLARMLGVDADEFEAVWPGIMCKFVSTEAGDIVNERLERERAKAMTNKAKAAAKAQQAALARWSSNDAPSIPGPNGSASNAASHDAPSNAPSNAPSINPTPKTPENMLGAMLEQCPPTPTPTPSPTPTLGGGSKGEPRIRKASNNGRAKTPEQQTESIKAAIKHWPDYGDADIARIAHASVEEVRNVRREQR